MSLYEPSNFDEDDELFELGERVLGLSRDDYGAAVHRSVHPDDTWFIVTWNDYVANEWRSLHETLAGALAHLSVIEFCDAHDVTLTVTPEQLDDHIRVFHRSVTWEEGGKR